MKDESVIGIIYRYGYDDYGFMIGDIPEEVSDNISGMIELNDLAGCRGDKTITLEDANIAFYEREWSKDKIIALMKVFYFDEDRDEIPSDEKIWKMIKKNPEEIIYGLLTCLENWEAEK